MWHEDILVWQKATESVYVLSGTDVTQVAIQNPQRVGILFFPSVRAAALALSPAMLDAGAGWLIGWKVVTASMVSTYPGLQFWYPKHGLLPSQAWYAANAGTGGNGTVYVVEVLMPNRPCPTWRIGNGQQQRRVRVQGSRQSVRGSGDQFNPLAWPQSAPAGTDLLPDESQ